MAAAGGFVLHGRPEARPASAESWGRVANYRLLVVFCQALGLFRRLEKVATGALVGLNALDVALGEPLLIRGLVALVLGAAQSVLVLALPKSSQPAPQAHRERSLEANGVSPPGSRRSRPA